MSTQVMTSTTRGMFPLAAVYPGWSGSRIDQMKAPLEAGMARLRADLDGAGGALVCIANLFDYDGMMQWINSVVPLGDEIDVIAERLLDAGVARARQQLSGLAESTAMPTPRPINVLPATGTIIPRRFPREVLGCRLENRRVYDSAEIRVLLVAPPAETGAADALLQCDGLSTPLIDYLAGLGGWRLAGLASAGSR